MSVHDIEWRRARFLYKRIMGDSSTNSFVGDDVCNEMLTMIGTLTFEKFLHLNKDLGGVGDAMGDEKDIGRWQSELFIDVIDCRSFEKLQKGIVDYLEGRLQRKEVLVKASAVQSLDRSGSKSVVGFGCY